MKIKAVVGSFAAAAMSYLLGLMGCMGSQSASGLGSACEVIGPVLRFPFLYWLPYADSRYLGVDSMFWAVIGNAAVWGSVTATIAFLIFGSKAR